MTALQDPVPGPRRKSIKDPLVMSYFQRIAEQKIQEAIKNGEFEDLESALISNEKERLTREKVLLQDTYNMLKEQRVFR
jgi:hypothetical protein